MRGTQGGVFATCEAAQAKCRAIVDEFLKSNYQGGMSAEQLLRAYKSYGEDPWIVGPDCSFSAWGYAEERCREICLKPE